LAEGVAIVGLSCPTEYTFNGIAAIISEFEGFGIAHRNRVKNILEMITGAKMVGFEVSKDIFGILFGTENSDCSTVEICIVAASGQIDFKQFIFLHNINSFLRILRTQNVFRVQ